MDYQRIKSILIFILKKLKLCIKIIYTSFKQIFFYFNITKIVSIIKFFFFISILFLIKRIRLVINYIKNFSYEEFKYKLEEKWDYYMDYLINDFFPAVGWYLNILERFFDVLEILALFFVINPSIKIWAYIEKKFFIYYELYLIKKKIKKAQTRKKRRLIKKKIKKEIIEPFKIVNIYYKILDFFIYFVIILIKFFSFFHKIVIKPVLSLLIFIIKFIYWPLNNVKFTTKYKNFLDVSEIIALVCWGITFLFLCMAIKYSFLRGDFLLKIRVSDSEFFRFRDLTLTHRNIIYHLNNIWFNSFSTINSVNEKKLESNHYDSEIKYKLETINTYPALLSLHIMSDILHKYNSAINNWGSLYYFSKDINSKIINFIDLNMQNRAKIYFKNENLNLKYKEIEKIQNYKKNQINLKYLNKILLKDFKDKNFGNNFKKILKVSNYFQTYFHFLDKIEDVTVDDAKLRFLSTSFDSWENNWNTRPKNFQKYKDFDRTSKRWWFYFWNYSMNAKLYKFEPFFTYSKRYSYHKKLVSKFYIPITNGETDLSLSSISQYMWFFRNKKLPIYYLPSLIAHFDAWYFLICSSLFLFYFVLFHSFVLFFFFKKKKKFYKKNFISNYAEIKNLLEINFWLRGYFLTSLIFLFLILSWFYVEYYFYKLEDFSSIYDEIKKSTQEYRELYDRYNKNIDIDIGEEMLELFLTNEFKNYSLVSKKFFNDPYLMDEIDIYENMYNRRDAATKFEVYMPDTYYFWRYCSSNDIYDMSALDNANWWNEFFAPKDNTGILDNFDFFKTGRYELSKLHFIPLNVKIMSPLASTDELNYIFSNNNFFYGIMNDENTFEERAFLHEFFKNTYYIDYKTHMNLFPFGTGEGRMMFESAYTTKRYIITEGGDYFSLATFVIPEVFMEQGIARLSTWYYSWPKSKRKIDLGYNDYIYSPINPLYDGLVCYKHAVENMYKYVSFNYTNRWSLGKNLEKYFKISDPTTCYTNKKLKFIYNSNYKWHPKLLTLDWWKCRRFYRTLLNYKFPFYHRFRKSKAWWTFFNYHRIHFTKFRENIFILKRKPVGTFELDWYRTVYKWLPKKRNWNYFFKFFDHLAYNKDFIKSTVWENLFSLPISFVKLHDTMIKPNENFINFFIKENNIENLKFYDEIFFDRDFWFLTHADKKSTLKFIENNQLTKNNLLENNFHYNKNQLKNFKIIYGMSDFWFDVNPQKDIWPTNFIFPGRRPPYSFSGLKSLFWKKFSTNAHVTSDSLWWFIREGTYKRRSREWQHRRNETTLEGNIRDEGWWRKKKRRRGKKKRRKKKRRRWKRKTIFRIKRRRLSTVFAWERLHLRRDILRKKKATRKFWQYRKYLIDASIRPYTYGMKRWYWDGVRKRGTLILRNRKVRKETCHQWKRFSLNTFLNKRRYSEGGPWFNVDFSRRLWLLWCRPYSRLIIQDRNNRVLEGEYNAIINLNSRLNAHGGVCYTYNWLNTAIIFMDNYLNKKKFVYQLYNIFMFQISHPLTLKTKKHKMPPQPIFWRDLSLWKVPINNWLHTFFQKKSVPSPFSVMRDIFYKINKFKGSPVRDIYMNKFIPKIGSFNFFLDFFNWVDYSNDNTYGNRANLLNLITNFGQGLESSYFTTASSNFYYDYYKEFIHYLDEYIEIYNKKKDQNLKNLWNLDIYHVNYDKYRNRIFKLAHIYLNKHYKINPTFGENIYYNFNILNFRNKMNSNTVINKKTGWDIGTSWYNLINCFNNKTYNFWPSYFWKKDFYDEDNRHFFNTLFKTTFSKTEMARYDYVFEFHKYMIKRICNSLLYLEIMSMLDIMDIETIHNIKLEHEGVRHTFYTRYLGNGISIGPIYHSKWKKGSWDYRCSILDKALDKLCNNYLMAGKYRNLHRMVTTSQCIKNKRIYEWVDRLIPAPPNDHPEAWWYRKVVGRYTSGIGASIIENKSYLNFYFLSFKYNCFYKDFVGQFVPNTKYDLNDFLKKYFFFKYMFFYKFNYFIFTDNKFDWRIITENKLKTQSKFFRREPLPELVFLPLLFNKDFTNHSYRLYRYYQAYNDNKYLHCDKNMNLFGFFNFSGFIFNKKYANSTIFKNPNYFNDRKEHIYYNNKFGLICETTPSWSKIKLTLDDLKEFNENYKNSNFFKKIEIFKNNKAYYFYLIFRLNYAIILFTMLLMFINKLFIKSINSFKKNSLVHPTYKLGQFLYEKNIAQTIANEFGYYLFYLISFLFLIIYNYFSIDILYFIDYLIYIFMKFPFFEWWFYIRNYFFLMNGHIFPWDKFGKPIIQFSSC